MKKLCISILVGFGLLTSSTGLASAGIVDSLFGEILVGIKSMKDLTCDDLEKIAKGAELKNEYGGTFKVIKASKSGKVSSSRAEISCRMSVWLDDGSKGPMLVTVSDEDGERFYTFQME